MGPNHEAPAYSIHTKPCCFFYRWYCMDYPSCKAPICTLYSKLNSTGTLYTRCVSILYIVFNWAMLFCYLAKLFAIKNNPPRQCVWPIHVCNLHTNQSCRFARLALGIVSEWWPLGNGIGGMRRWHDSVAVYTLSHEKYRCLLQKIPIQTLFGYYWPRSYCTNLVQCHYPWPISTCLHSVWASRHWKNIHCTNFS